MSRRVYKLQLNQSKFDEVYKEFQSKVNKSSVLADLIEAVRGELAGNGELTYGMNFSVENYIAKPLSDKGFSKIGSAVLYLVDKGMLKKSTNMGNVEFTQEGWDWIHSTGEKINGKKIELRDIADNYKYTLQKEIEDISGGLFRDGYYAQSVFEACKKVINKVKELAPEVDASSDYGRMGKIFNPENPVIKFNNLQNQSEVDEQKGFMHLFLGLVMIRNFNGHENVKLNDAGRAFEYLSLTSLLISKLEERIKDDYEAKK